MIRRYALSAAGLRVVTHRTVAAYRAVSIPLGLYPPHGLHTPHGPCTLHGVHAPLGLYSLCTLDLLYYRQQVYHIPGMSFMWRAEPATLEQSDLKRRFPRWYCVDD